MLKRIPWVAVLVSAAVVLSSAFAVPPIGDAATLADVSEVYLTRPLGYVMLAPLSAVLDTLPLLSARQHIALLLGAIVVFALWRVVRARGAGNVRPTVLQHLAAAAAFFVVVIATYAAAAVLPRPMAAIVSDNANIVRIDFHSHTAASHDGRTGWSAEDVREWHREGGYDVAYIADHATVAGAEQGMARNPALAGEGVTLLQSIEATWTGEHVCILGAQRVYKGVLTENLRDVDEQGLRLASSVAGREPVVIWNHPRVLTRLPAATGPGTAGVRAIEVANGAPNSSGEVRRNRAAIVQLAQAKNFTLVSGSDNHGWGGVAPNWTLMLIFGWRGMAADSLGRQIENVVRQAGVAGSRVIERRVADGSSPLPLVFTLLTAPARMLTTLSNDERVAWLIWIWFFVGIAWVLRRVREGRVAA